MKPKYYIRPDDCEVFSLNEDGETYSLKVSKEKWPNHRHSVYPEWVMKDCGFYVGHEERFTEYKAKQAEYHRRIDEECRANHCGCGSDDD
jgi:hypothetical protein